MYTRLEVGIYVLTDKMECLVDRMVKRIVNDAVVVCVSDIKTRHSSDADEACVIASWPQVINTETIKIFNCDFMEGIRNSNGHWENVNANSSDSSDCRQTNYYENVWVCCYIHIISKIRWQNISVTHTELELDRELWKYVSHCSSSNGVAYL